MLVKKPAMLSDVDKGINKFRLTYKGYGESRPVATNETDEGRQLNRRIVLVLDEE